ncbi:MAG: hypothetical protein ABSE45_02955 [Candidatus Acidiferrales bacterium]|jgi:hypothetical protein
MRMFKGISFLLLTLFVLVGIASAPAQAQRFDKDTTVTFNQPVEVPGKIILAAGTYRLRVLPGNMSRNVVQIWNEDGMKLITTVLTIADYRLGPADETVIEFHERPSGRPAALRAWFYPGHNFGNEFVYPKERAVELAQASNEVVPAETVEPTAGEMETIPLVAVTPEAKEVPLAEAIQTAPSQEVAQLPKTASVTPLIALLGLLSISLGAGLKLFARRAF